MGEIILDELNVKALEFADAEDQLLTYSVRPNLPSLGPRYGRQVAAIRAALAALDPAGVVAALERGESVRLQLDGGDVVLGAEDILFSATEREGFAAMASDGFLVALDTDLTPELRAEGLARQVVRRINDWRKAAGYSIEDRIGVRYQGSEEVKYAIQQYAAHVRQETLATRLVAEPPSGTGFAAEARFDGQWLEVELERA
jgi:isoleucyl-tRNA synthetase